MTTPLTIFVDGNIASGKTTLCKKFESNLDYMVFLEDYEKEPSLIDYYKDTEYLDVKFDWYRFQTRLFTKWMDRMVELKARLNSNNPPKVIVFDRSVYSSIVFYWYAVGCGIVDSEDMSVLTHSSLMYLDLLFEQIHGEWVFIYIDTEHEEVLSRALSRNKETGLVVNQKQFKVIRDNDIQRDPNIFTPDNFNFLSKCDNLLIRTMEIKFSHKKNIHFKRIAGDQTELYDQTKEIIDKGLNKIFI